MNETLDLRPLTQTSFPFHITVANFSENAHVILLFTVTALETAFPITKTYRVPFKDRNAYLGLLDALARDFNIRLPLNRRPLPEPTFHVEFQALLTKTLDTRILYGYGDPAVVRIGGDATEAEAWYYVVSTSNDALNSFPIVRSKDLKVWEFAGFVFPDGTPPKWAKHGENISDYWAPELHEVGGEFRVYFAARHKDTGELCIGVATSDRPTGPFLAAAEPLLRNGRIDPHVFVEDDGASYLYWKDDNNDVWRNLLNEFLFKYPRYISRLFLTNEDQRSASFVATLWPWTRTAEPLERFVQTSLIEAVTSDFSAFEARLQSLLTQPLLTQSLLTEEAEDDVRSQVQEILRHLKTPITVRQLSADGLSLTGSPVKVLENDQPWEAHVIEGIWVVKHAGRYYMFYAGNDYSTADYGIGAAVSASPFGPFQKMPGALLHTTREWSSPGHPSVAIGPNGEYMLFLHAYFPGKVGYREFRALLAVELNLEGRWPAIADRTSAAPAIPGG